MSQITPELLAEASKNADFKPRSSYGSLASMLSFQKGWFSEARRAMNLKANEVPEIVEGEEDDDEIYMDDMPSGGHSVELNRLLKYVLGDAGKIVARVDDGQFLIERNDMFVLIDIDYVLHVSAFGEDYDAIQIFVSALHDEFNFVPPPRPRPVDGSTWVNIWLMGPMGPQSYDKRLLFQPWEEIRENYSEEARTSLDYVMSKRPEADSGMLVWTGPPGTGKTTAIRTLIREWKEFATPHIISDTEVFLNDPKYLHQVAMDGGESNLIILEDAGEMLIRDANEKSGQALSRLLNFTDGILGQGMKVYFLLTTNEDFEELHGAVTRPGRAIPHGVIHFGDLEVEEANNWLIDNGVESTVTEPTSLASLYAIKSAQIEASKEEVPANTLV